MNLAKVATNSVASVWVVPLGQTPDYLDPQSHEALHEVDVSGTALLFSFGQRPEGEVIEGLGVMISGGMTADGQSCTRQTKTDIRV
ncbi:MAG: hypothetical protein ACT4OO_08960 [Nitrospiraceae bacterium]